MDGKRKIKRHSLHTKSLSDICEEEETRGHEVTGSSWTAENNQQQSLTTSDGCTQVPMMVTSSNTNTDCTDRGMDGKRKNKGPLHTKSLSDICEEEEPCGHEVTGSSWTAENNQQQSLTTSLEPAHVPMTIASTSSNTDCIEKRRDEVKRRKSKRRSLRILKSSSCASEEESENFGSTWVGDSRDQCSPNACNSSLQSSHFQVTVTYPKTGSDTSSGIHVLSAGDNVNCCPQMQKKDLQLVPMTSASPNTDSDMCSGIGILNTGDYIVNSSPQIQTKDPHLVQITAASSNTNSDMCSDVCVLNTGDSTVNCSPHLLKKDVQLVPITRASPNTDSDMCSDHVCGLNTGESIVDSSPQILKKDVQLVPMTVTSPNTDSDKCSDHVCVLNSGDKILNSSSQILKKDLQLVLMPNASPNRDSDKCSEMHVLNTGDKIGNSSPQWHKKGLQLVQANNASPNTDSGRHQDTGLSLNSPNTGNNLVSYSLQPKETYLQQDEDNCTPSKAVSFESEVGGDISLNTGFCDLESSRSSDIIRTSPSNYTFTDEFSGNSAQGKMLLSGDLYLENTQTVAQSPDNLQNVRNQSSPSKTPTSLKIPPLVDNSILLETEGTHPYLPAISNSVKILSPNPMSVFSASPDVHISVCDYADANANQSAELLDDNVNLVNCNKSLSEVSIDVTEEDRTVSTVGNQVDRDFDKNASLDVHEGDESTRGIPSSEATNLNSGIFYQSAVVSEEQCFSLVHRTPSVSTDSNTLLSPSRLKKQQRARDVKKAKKERRRSTFGAELRLEEYMEQDAPVNSYDTLVHGRLTDNCTIDAEEIKKTAKKRQHTDVEKRYDSDDGKKPMENTQVGYRARKRGKTEKKTETSTSATEDCPDSMKAGGDDNSLVSSRRRSSLQLYRRKSRYRTISEVTDENCDTIEKDCSDLPSIADGKGQMKANGSENIATCSDESDDIAVTPELEILYKNKNYKAPRDKSWETIFESPSKGKHISAQKRRRSLPDHDYKVPAYVLKRRMNKAIQNGWKKKRSQMTKSKVTEQDVLEKLQKLDEEMLSDDENS